jgi:hypothetical protein
MPARDYSVAPAIRSYSLTNYPRTSDISAHRLRYQGQTDIDPERSSPPNSVSHEKPDKPKHSVSSSDSDYLFI